jgi:parvulin-like peptidyl-prolyl isomerase
MKGDWAMMSKMRENMPLIMWILVGAFLATIVFSWGMGGFKGKQTLDGVVGNVGEREILYDQYNRLVQDRLARQRKEGDKEKPAPITDEMVRQARKDVWDELVRSELMDVYGQRWGIVTSDEEVAFAVRNSPPKWIRENENFLKDGQFDRARYEEFLRDPRSAQVLVSIENEYRSSIGNQKVIERVIAPVFVSPDEVWNEYAATTRKLNALVVSFPLNKFTVDTGSITSAQIEAYYTQNRANYERKEQRKLAYVTIPVEATREDSNRVVELAQETLNRALSGEDFAALAQELSEDPGSAEQGGDLGYFVQGRMVKEFDSTAFATAPGQVVGPVLTRFGAHIIKVVDRKPAAGGDSVRASHVLIKWKASSETDERAGQKAKDFVDAAKAEGFAQAAARFGLEVKETDWFNQSSTGNVPGFGALPPAMDFAFSSKPGAISNLLRTKPRGGDAYVVFQLKETQPRGYAALAEVESTIRSLLVREKQRDLALDAARAFRGRVQDSESFAAEAARQGLKIDTTGERGQRESLVPIGTDENAAKYLFTLQIGQVSEPLSNSRGAYVAVLIGKTEPDPADFETKKADILQRLQRTKQNNVYVDWLSKAQKEVGVVDKRYLYYTDY